MQILSRDDVVNFVAHARETQSKKKAFGYTAAKKARGGMKLFELAKEEGFLAAQPSNLPHIPVYYTYRLDNDDAHVVETLWHMYRENLSPRALRQLNGIRLSKRPSNGTIARLNRIEKKLDSLLAQNDGKS